MYRVHCMHATQDRHAFDNDRQGDDWYPNILPVQPKIGSPFASRGPLG